MDLRYSTFRGTWRNSSRDGAPAPPEGVVLEELVRVEQAYLADGGLGHEVEDVRAAAPEPDDGDGVAGQAFHQGADAHSGGCGIDVVEHAVAFLLRLPEDPGGCVRFEHGGGPGEDGGVGAHLLVVVLVAGVGLAREAVLRGQPVAEVEVAAAVLDRLDPRAVGVAREIAVEPDLVGVRRPGDVPCHVQARDESARADPPTRVDIGDLAHHQETAPDLHEVPLVAEALQVRTKIERCA